jgi:tetratricopeptide (TPR) repeat protein
MHDDPAAALRVLEQAEKTCREEEVHTMLPSVVAGLGIACARCGFTERAINILQDALDQNTYHQAGNYTCYYLLMAIAEAHLIAGHVDAALERAADAEQRARRNSEGAHLAQALHLLGRIHARRDLARAEQAFTEARMRGERHGMAPLVADCWLGLAEIDRSLGRAAAPQRFARAKELFLNLGLPQRAQHATL